MDQPKRKYVCKDCDEFSTDDRASLDVHYNFEHELIVELSYLEPEVILEELDGQVNLKPRNTVVIRLVISLLIQDKDLMYICVLSMMFTGKSLSEALVLAETNPQYDRRYYKLKTCCVHKLFLVFVLTFRTIYVHNMI